MDSYPRRLVPAACALLGLHVACLPTERSDELSVELDPVPALILRDSVQLSARVVTGDGAPVQNPRIVYTSTDSTVITISSSGLLRAVGVGTATLAARAESFENAAVATQDLRVSGLLAVDSVTPTDVRFGTKITLFGVGLDPDSLFSIQLGGADIPVDSSSWVPDDPERPQGFGTLQIWAAPPAPERAELAVIGFKGGVVFPDTLRVFQRDIFEPNDTVATNLGTLEGVGPSLYNPGLAFEPRRRDEDIGITDWYRFSNASQRNRTLIIFGEDVGAKTFNVFVTDSLEWDGTQQTFFIGPQAWTIGPETYFCEGLAMSSGGEAFQPFELPFPFTWIALGDLPVGTYDLLIVYDAPPTAARYSMIVWNGYLSAQQRDVAEENDYCDQAKDLSVGTSAPNLTIDAPHDIDWFKFTVGGLGQIVTLSTASPDTTVDVDLYLVANHLPDSLPVRAIAANFGSDEQIGPTFLEAGDYFLIVMDYEGRPGVYTLGAAFAAPPAGAVLPGPGPSLSPADVAGLKAKRQSASAVRSTLIRRRGTPRQ